MKGAIATVELFVSNATRASDRLSLVIAAPERSPIGGGWQCRVALADLHGAETVVGRDSVEALTLALSVARIWLEELRAEGRVLSRDRSGKIPFELP